MTICQSFQLDYCLFRDIRSTMSDELGAETVDWWIWMLSWGVVIVRTLLQFFGALFKEVRSGHAPTLSTKIKDIAINKVSIIKIIIWFGDHSSPCHTLQNVLLTNYLHHFLQRLSSFSPDMASSRFPKALTWPQFNRHVLDNYGWVKRHTKDTADEFKTFNIRHRNKFNSAACSASETGLRDAQ